MRSRFSKALWIALLASSTACVTTPSRPRHKSMTDKQLAKEGQKVPGGESAVAAGSGNAPGAVPASPSAADVPGLWTRTNNMLVPMSEEDLMRATQLYPAQAGSLEEAIFVVTQMRILQKDWERRTSFQTQDLHTNQTADNTAGLSLEKSFKDMDVDLPTTLRNNAALKNHESLLLAKQLTAHTNNSEAFRTAMNGAVKERGAEWPDLMADDVAAPAQPQGAAPVDAAAAAVPPVGVPADAAVAPASAATPAPADANAALDLMGSDTLLIAAQKLADKRDFKAAIDHVARIKKEDPFYAQAQEKQKQYSNRAVKDLRQKAAEAFSNAAPLNDTKAKTSYLKQAKNYLEQALKDFPLAELDTVRENLEAVNRDLESLDKSGT